MPYLIVNGDDFGLSPGVNRGILEAHRRGVLTSTSLMVHRPACAEAAILARECPALSIGLHLDLEDTPGDPAMSVRAQFERFERVLGRSPTHVDGHHDCHLRPEWLPHALTHGARLGIPVRGHSAVARLGRFYGQWGGQSHLEAVSAESLIALLRTDLVDGVTELICHPGYVDPSLTSSYAAEREAEVAALCDVRVREAIHAMGVRLIGFGAVPGLAGLPVPGVESSP